MSSVVRRSLLALVILVSGACGRFSTEPRLDRASKVATPHFDSSDTTSRSGFIVPNG